MIRNSHKRSEASGSPSQKRWSWWADIVLNPLDHEWEVHVWVKSGEQLLLMSLRRKVSWLYRYKDVSKPWRRWSTASYSCLLSILRYLQGKPEEALSLLTESEEKTRECYGRESELRLIVTYGDLAWLKYHTEDYEQSQTYCQRVADILARIHPQKHDWFNLFLNTSLTPTHRRCYESRGADYNNNHLKDPCL